MYKGMPIQKIAATTQATRTTVDVEAVRLGDARAHPAEDPVSRDHGGAGCGGVGAVSARAAGEAAVVRSGAHSCP